MIILALALAVLIVWRVVQKQAEVAGQAATRAARMNAAATVTLAPVEVRDISRTYQATGSVEAPLSVKIAPKITGRITYLEVHEGDRVKKGQVLVRIDSTEVEANVQQQMAAVAEARYRLAQAQLNQTPTDVAVNTQIQKQRAELVSAEAEYKQTQKSVEAQIAAASANLSDAQYRIENARAAITSAKANLENARTKHARYQGLYEKGYVSAQNLDDVRAELVVQESAVEVAEGQLKSATAMKDAAQQQYNVTQSKGQADIAASKAKLDQAKASLEYALANTSSKSAYSQSIAALKSSVEAAEASLKSAQARRLDTVLVSPLDGFVTGRFSDPGAIASPTQPILAVQFVKQVWVTASVPEDVCAKLHIGGPVSIKLDALPEKTLAASIIQINPSADPQSRQFTVRAILSNTQDLLKPGMFAHVSFETDRVKGAVVVPREAIQKDAAGPHVMAADGSMKARRVAVRTGAEDERFVGIQGDIKPGDRVVTLAAVSLKDGQQLDSGGKSGRNNGPGGGKSSR